MKKWRSILLFIGPGRKQYLIGLVGAALLMAALDVCLAPILDSLISAAVERRADLLVRAVAIAATAVALACVAVPFLQYLYATAVRKGINGIRSEAFRRMALGRSDEAIHSGEVLSVLTNDVSLMEELLGDSLVRFVTQLFLAVFAIGMMATYDLRITLAVVSVTLAGSLVNNHLAKRAAVHAKAAMQGTAEYVSKVTDLVAGFSVMKVFHLEEPLLGEMETENRKIAEAASRNGLVRAGMETFNGLLKTFCCMLVLILGIQAVMNGELTFGPLAAILQLTSLIMLFFFQFSQAVTGLQQSFAAAGRILPILEREHESESIRLPGPAGIPESRFAQNPESGLAIDISGLCVEIGGRRILSDLTLSVKKNRMTALVGQSGSGKSTLMRTLLGLQDPCEGYAEVLEHPVSALSRDSLRMRFAYVPQDAWLFDQDILENIRAGRPGATDHMVREAAVQADAHAFIQTLPEGYSTRVGTGGGRLSGGQRQRVALARAILSEAPILLLDEPTAALDAEAERRVLESLRELSRTRTVLVATHRPSVIKHSDYVIALEAGRFIASGTPESMREPWGQAGAWEGAR